ncbi:MAG: hypothetical protein J6O41_03620, partial [Clostridia bacterium]|nr:hypothetical protein [Clostridia bacterium]
FCTRANGLQEAVDIILEQEKFLKTFLIEEQNKRIEQGQGLKIKVPELKGDDYKKIFNYDTD